MHVNRNRRLWLVLAVAALGGCGKKAEPPPVVQAPAPAQQIASNPVRSAWFGDLHVHTSLSVDAYITTTRTLPDDAYRYAKGEPIDHVSGRKIQLSRPLDFMAVTDHSEMLGMARAMSDPENPLSKLPDAEGITSTDYEVSQRTFKELVRRHAAGEDSALTKLLGGVLLKSSGKEAWQMEIDAAARHYQPGSFTSFIGYEWTSMPDLANLHRNVIFSGTAVPELPFTSVDSDKPEDLWAFLDQWRTGSGEDVIAIPHNSNASKGLMFPLQDSFGKPLDAAYAAAREHNEPVTELTQFKGTSEVHPALSPRDEFADFEIWNTVVGAPIAIPPDEGGYVRNAFLRGIELEDTQGFNPYRFGVVGGSDTHNSSSAIEENNFTGGHGNADATPEKRLHSKESTLVLDSTNFSAAGLSGVWAESNTRESIFAALRRRETFATSGPRITLRFFAGADYADDALGRADALEQAYAGGVPMGGVLDAGTASPEFLVWANMDPAGTKLQRVQIVKGWVADGETQEAVYDVACSDGGVPDAATARCPDNGATVNLADCSLSGQGSASLAAAWHDPHFDPAQRAFYYVRVLENPSCRWSSWDAVRIGEPLPEGVHPTLQERAWSSPIWVQPRHAGSGG